MTDYITHNGQIFYDRAQPFIALLGMHENKVFSKRIQTMEKDAKKYKINTRKAAGKEYSVYTDKSK